VAYYASERLWVNFKVFGLTSLTLAFVASQVLWLTPALGSGLSRALRTGLRQGLR